MTEPAAGVRIRQMTYEDLPAVMKLEREIFPEDPWTEGMMRGELDEQPRTRHYLVATDGDEIVQTIAVRADHRRAGIGRTLLSMLLEEAVRRGAAWVFLEVRADNAPARTMYERFGFERIGVRRRYYADGTDAYTMRKRLR